MSNTRSVDFERSSSQFASRADASLVGLDITGTFTIEAWIKLESLPASGEYYGIVCKMDDILTGADNTKSQWGFWYDNDSGRRLQLFVRETGANNSVTYTVTLSTGTWYHVAGVFTSSTTMKIYLDGTEVASSSTSIPSASVNTAQPFVVGGMDGGSYFDGLIDEVRVWNVARTQTQISDNMDVELVGNESGLVAYYRFENDYTDTTANDNDLTASNSPTFSTDVPFVTSIAYTIVCALGTFTLTGTATGLKLARILVASVGSYTLTGFATGLSLGKKILAELGSYILTGNNININVALSMIMGTGSYVLTGTATGLKIGRILVAELGSYVLTGTDTVLRLGRKIILELGTFTLTGQSASFSKGFHLALATGSYILTGFAVKFPIFWRTITKNVVSIVNRVKNVESWTNSDKTNI